MQLKLSDISPGDIIEHESWGCNHGGVQERLTRRKGKVIQVTDKVITLQGKNYPETLLVNDLLSGRAKILKVKMRGEEDMVKYDWDTLWPQVQELQAEGKTIVAIAEEMNINLYALRSKLYRERQEEKQTLPPEPETTKLVCETCVSHHVDDGVCWCIDNKTEHSGSCGSCSKYPSGCIYWERQTQPPEPDQAANQEPDEEEGESATEIIPDTKAYYTEPVNIPLGCLLPPQGAELPRNEQEPANGCGDTTSDTKTNYGQGRGQSGEINWPPRDNVEKVLLETTMNARFAVRRVLNDPVALALMKQVLGSGVV